MNGNNRRGKLLSPRAVKEVVNSSGIVTIQCYYGYKRAPLYFEDMR